MKRVLLGFFICMLLIIPVLSISCEAKEIVFISGRGCNGFTANDFLLPHRFGLLFPFWSFIKSNQSGNTLSLDYKESSTLLIVNGIPQRIMQPAKIELGLTEPNTFGFVKIFLYNVLAGDQGTGVKVFGIFDSLKVIQH